MSKKQAPAPIRARDIRHGWTFGDRVRMKHCKLEIATGNKKVKGKDGKRFTIPQTEQLETDSPVGYIVDVLRRELWAKAKLVMSGKHKKVEFRLDRFPQVATVMGEINAHMPKGKKLVCGWTTDDITNTLYTIERPKRK